MTCRRCASYGVVSKYTMDGQVAEYCWQCFQHILVSFVLTENEYPDLTVKEVRETLLAGLTTNKTF